MTASAYDVLVVDDEPVVLAAARKILVAEGLETDVADSAETASRKMSSNRYKVVLCDLMLPGTRGFDLVEKTRELLPGAPVVMISGYATLESALGGFKHGVFDFIPKPFDVGELLGVVRRGLDFAGAAEAEISALDLDAWLRRAPTSDGSPGTVYFLGEHAWVVLDSNGRARIGMGETFACLGGEFDEVELPVVGEDQMQGNRCLRIETSDQLVHRLWSPLSGQVIATNERAFSEAKNGGLGAICRRWVVEVIPGDLKSELPNLTLREENGGSPHRTSCGPTARGEKW